MCVNDYGKRKTIRTTDGGARVEKSRQKRMRTMKCIESPHQLRFKF